MISQPAWFRLLAVLAATAAVCVSVGVVVNSIFFRGGGPEGAIVTRLKSLEVSGISMDSGGGMLNASTPSFQRISVAVDSNEQGAYVTSTLDFTGVLVRPDGSRTEVSSLGLERARYRLADGQWVPESSDAPRLGSIVSLLEKRRIAIEKGEPQADGGAFWSEVRSQRAYRSEAWFIRSERDEVEVAEDFRLTGSTLERPVDHKGIARFGLQLAAQP